MNMNKENKSNNSLELVAALWKILRPRSSQPERYSEGFQLENIMR